MARSLQLGAALCACVLLGSTGRATSAELAPDSPRAMNEGPAGTGGGVRGSDSAGAGDRLPALPDDRGARTKAGATADLIIHEGNGIRHVDDSQRNGPEKDEELEGRHLGESVAVHQYRPPSHHRTAWPSKTIPPRFGHLTTIHHLTTTTAGECGNCVISGYTGTCDAWYSQYGFSCDTLENTYGCDCTYCDCPTIAPTPTETCRDNCYSKTCDEWTNNDLKCEYLESAYSCDCRWASCVALRSLRRIPPSLPSCASSFRRS